MLCRFSFRWTQDRQTDRRTACNAYCSLLGEGRVITEQAKCHLMTVTNVQRRRSQRPHRHVGAISETGSDVIGDVTDTSSADSDSQWNAISSLTRRPSVVDVQDSFSAPRFDLFSFIQRRVWLFLRQTQRKLANEAIRDGISSHYPRQNSS